MRRGDALLAPQFTPIHARLCLRFKPRYKYVLISISRCLSIEIKRLAPDVAR